MFTATVSPGWSAANLKAIISSLDMAENRAQMTVMVSHYNKFVIFTSVHRDVLTAGRKVFPVAVRTLFHLTFLS